MSNESVVLINLLTAKPGKQEKLVALLKQSISAVIRTMPGWKKTELIAESNGSSVAIYSEWESAFALEAMRADPRMKPYLLQIAGLATMHSIEGSSSWSISRENAKEDQDNAMARMVVIYKRPADVDAFTKHYWETHIPLAKRLPNLRKYEVSQGPVTVVAGPPDVHLVGTLYFDDMDAIKVAFASPEGQAAAADRRVYAPDASGVQMFLFASREA